MRYPSDAVRELRRKLGRAEWAPIGGAGTESKYTRPIEYSPEHNGRRHVAGLSRGLRAVSANSVFRAAGRYHEATGWYVDLFQSETTVPHVAALPAHGGERRLYAATSDPWNADAFLVDFGACYDDELSAANSAQSLAEAYAEECRDDAVRFQAEQDIETAQEEIRDARAEHSATIRELSEPIFAGGFYGVAQDAMRQRCAKNRADVRKAVQLIRKRREDPYSASPSL